jgi:hypothetical protein
VAFRPDKIGCGSDEVCRLIAGVTVKWSCAVSNDCSFCSGRAEPSVPEVVVELNRSRRALTEVTVTSCSFSFSWGMVGDVEAVTGVVGLVGFVGTVGAGRRDAAGTGCGEADRELGAVDNLLSLELI